MSIQPDPNSKRVRMRDVANRLGVSISTVSLVLSGDNRIPEDTVRRVLAAVKAMEYRPSVLARSLARRVSRTIGVILPEFAFQLNRPFYYQALAGIHSQTQPAGYKMVVEASNSVFLARRYYLRMLREQSADGMIYLAASLNDQFLTELEKEKFPFVFVGSYVDGLNLPIAKSNDSAGAKMAVQHLIKLGHTAIGHLAGLPTISHGRDRTNGYREAMKEAGLVVQPGWVQEGGFDMGLSEKATETILKTKVTALFAGSDTMAYGAIRALHNLGLNVPGDVAIVGMDDLEMSSWSNPALTTVRYDIQTIASLATSYVFRRIQNPLLPNSPLDKTPEPELIIRRSCGSKI